jgi:hypothetical protein
VVHRSFDQEMEALEALKGQPMDAAAVALIRKALAGKNNFLAAKAARLAEQNELRDLLPELIAVFQRFFEQAEKTDPQCWAKNAISHALPRLGCREKDVFLRGLHHHQWEPTWGGRSDSAGTLRANCAHALVACEGLTNDELLLLLLDLLVDADKSVRLEVVRAMAHIGEAAVPVLRLRALIRGEELEVLASCFSALLAVDGKTGIRFVARFLSAGDDAAGEAAFALADTHSPAALAALLEARRSQSSPEPWFRGALLSAIALTRLDEAADHLIGLIERDELDAPLAIEALGKAAPGDKLRARIERAVNEVGSPRLDKALSEHLKAS